MTMRMFKWFQKLFSRKEEEVVKLVNNETGIPVTQTEEGKLWLQIVDNECPDCGARFKGFMEGPSGGMSTNIMCFGCKHWFNVTPVIGIADRLSKVGE